MVVSKDKTGELAPDDDLQRFVEAARAQEADREGRPPASRKLLERMQAELPPEEMLETVLKRERAGS